jgi:hypothetical protein
MKFGIFYEHQLPRPWTERSEYELLQNSLAQIELADGLGYDYAWEVEHHFLEEYSHFNFPARNVVPKPLQKPHPPLWVACSNIQTIASAGGWGMGALGFQFVSPEAARAWVNKYYISITKHLNKLTDYPTNPNIAMVSGFQKALRSGLIGSPETIRRTLRQFEAAHVDQVILLNQAGMATHEDICASLERFAREVMPEFHARESEQQRWKEDVLAGRIHLEDLDTAGYKTYSHQNEDIVRLTPEELKRKMAEKEAAR